jgi:uncharacterized protein YecE (DUF72 family)
VSDVPETPDGAAQTGEGPVEHAAESPPWGDNFNPERAWSTIQDQRRERDQLEAEVKQFRALREDPDAQRAFLEELGYEIPDDEPEQPDWAQEDDYADPTEARIAQVEDRLSQIQQQEEMQQIAAHVAELTQDSGLDLDTQKYLFEIATQPGYNPQRTEKIVKQHIAAVKAAEERAIEQYRESKRTQTPPPPGTAGEPAPDLKDDKARREYLGRLVDAYSQDT